MAILWRTPGFEERNSDSSGFSTEVTLISASAVPHCDVEEEEEEDEEE